MKKEILPQYVYRGEIGVHYTSIDVKNLDFKRFLKFQISLHCNINQPNHYLC